MSVWSTDLPSKVTNGRALGNEVCEYVEDEHYQIYPPCFFNQCLYDESVVESGMLMSNSSKTLLFILFMVLCDCFLNYFVLMWWCSDVLSATSKMSHII